MEWLTPKMVEILLNAAREGGLALTLILVLIGYVFELRRSAAKDKIIAEERKLNNDLQTKTLTLMGEMKTAVSNGNLLLEMLTRGRR